MFLRRRLHRWFLLLVSAPAAAWWTASSAADDAARLQSPDWVRRFYEERDARPAWQDARCEELHSALLVAVEASASHGLRPADYHYDRLKAAGACAPHTEVLASDAWLSLARHLREGRVDPVSVSPHWTLVHEPLDYAARLEVALAEGDLAAQMDGLVPAESDYLQLRRELSALRDLVQTAPVVVPEEGAMLRAGDAGPRVAALRARLQGLGWLAPAHGTLDTSGAAAPDAGVHEATRTRDGLESSASVQDAFDESVEDALRAFQRSVNLEPDGVAGPRTLSELRQGPAQRIDQLRANLERWRWLPRSLGRRHIRVNIADFRLEAWHQGRLERTHAVIVGSHFRPTPSFSASVSYLVLNPDWVVPRRLAVQDKLPLFRRDPSAFDRLGFDLYDRAGVHVDAAAIDWQALSRNHFPYRLTQRPGAANALGQVKLILPNPHDIYLHDTPTRGLFSKVRRDFSSGCIRVDDALGLSEWVLGETRGWDRARIDATLASGQRTRADLAAPLPVHLFYITTPVAADGSIRFVADLYGQDARVLAALDSASAP